MNEKRSRAMCTFRIWEPNDPSMLENARIVISSLEGVTNSRAYHRSQMLTVEYDPERITFDTIQTAIRRIGRQ